VTQTSVCADLLQPFEVLAQLVLHLVSQYLRVLAVDDITLSVEKPGGDLVLGRVLDDGDDALEFFGGDFSGAASNCVNRLSPTRRISRRIVVGLVLFCLFILFHRSWVLG
jgi:hypothetical protein